MTQSGGWNTKKSEMNDKEKARLDLKISNEEYGQPDFAPLWTVLLVISSIAVLGSLIWFLWTLLKPAISC